MYDEEGTAADHKMEDVRMGLGNGGVEAGASIGIGGPGGAGAGGGGGLTGYWQHAASTAAGYWPSLLDCWSTPSSITASGSQSLSLPRDDHNRGQ